MILLPENVCERLEIDPSTEFNVMFRMPPMRLALIFHCLSRKKTDHVTISVKDNGGVENVSFIKDVLPPGEEECSTSSENERYVTWLISNRISADENEADDIYKFYTEGLISSSNDDDDAKDKVDEEDAYRYRVCCNHNADDVKYHSKATSIDMRCEFKTLLCMMCLHDYIITTTVVFKDATQVIMCLGQQRSVIIYRNRENEFNGFVAPSANHKYHPTLFRDFVRRESIREFEDVEDEMGAANEREGNENQVNEEVRGAAIDAEEDGQEGEK